jgi:hypothetical protein
VKEKRNRVRRQITEWKEILENHASDKGMVYIRNSNDSIAHKTETLQKMGKEYRHFSREGIEISNKYMKKIFNIINRQGNTNKTTMRYHLTPVKMSTTKMTKN